MKHCISPNLQSNFLIICIHFYLSWMVRRGKINDFLWTLMCSSGTSLSFGLMKMHKMKRDTPSQSAKTDSVDLINHL